MNSLIIGLKKIEKITILALILTTLIARNSVSQVEYKTFTIYNLPNFEDAISYEEVFSIEEQSNLKPVIFLPRENPCPTQYFIQQHLPNFQNDSILVKIYFEIYLDHSSPLVLITNQLHRGPIPIGLFFHGTYYAIIETLGGGGCVATLVLSTAFADQCPIVLKYFNCPN